MLGEKAVVETSLHNLWAVVVEMYIAVERAAGAAECAFIGGRAGAESAQDRIGGSRERAVLRIGYIGNLQASDIANAGLDPSRLSLSFHLGRRQGVAQAIGNRGGPLGRVDAECPIAASAVRPNRKEPSAVIKSVVHCRKTVGKGLRRSAAVHHRLNIGIRRQLKSCLLLNGKGLAGGAA